MTLKLVLDQYVQNQFDFDRPINFRIYDEDEQPFDTSTYTKAVAKTFMDTRALFVGGWRNVATGFGYIHPEGTVSQLVSDIPVTWTDPANGQGSFAYTQTTRPSRAGIQYIEIELSKPNEQTSTERTRLTVRPSPGSN